VRASGRTVALPLRDVRGQLLAEPQRGRSPFLPPVVALAPDGLGAAFSDQPPGQVVPLTVTRADGSQADVALPGARGVAFAADGSTLVVIDGAGALWRIDPTTGASVRVAVGPFGSSPSLLADGRILAVRLSSVEAPAWARAVFVDPETGQEAPVMSGDEAGEALVYQALPLDDGGVGIVRHRDEGGITVLLVGDGQAHHSILDLDAVATVDLTRDGTLLAWSAMGRAYLSPAGQVAAARDVGPADRVRFSPNGALLLLSTAGAGTVLDVSGRVVGPVSPAACWLGDGRGCRP
jgi:hypothetical protein